MSVEAADYVSIVERMVWAMERSFDREPTDLIAAAKEILREIRRPSDQMIISGNAEDEVGEKAAAILHWQAMIDEALRS